MTPTNPLAAPGLRGLGACALAGSGRGTADVFTAAWQGINPMLKTRGTRRLGSEPM